MMRPTILLFLLPLAAACSRGGDKSPAPPASASAAPSPAPKGTLALGEPITSPMLALSDVAAHPGHYDGRTIATSGKVTAVCQEMGCWMEIADASGRAHVRMHGHSFFVPKTASGHLARVQATVVKGTDDECDDDGTSAASPRRGPHQSESPHGSPGMAKIELDATGVELD